MKQTKEPIYTICFDCAKTFKTKDKTHFGVWNDTCDVCNEMRPCASASHDFGIKPDGIEMTDREWRLENSI